MGRAIQSFETGTAIKIVTVLSDGPATSATITIYDPSDVAKVTNGVMVENSDRVWSYVWQTSDSVNISGTYKAVITVIKDAYTSVKVRYFKLVDEDSPYL